MLAKVVSIHKNNSPPLPFIDEQTKAQGIKIQTSHSQQECQEQEDPDWSPAWNTGPATEVGEEQCEAGRNSLHGTTPF